eukprot:CAMPEP_0113484580 /NCGR_PEP_ID=MMETSP0014_2-20120614/24034_1 /TAXON_ID=2857 /ORGANISM="Nitzschia sp." /LENGTH=630 /DNA_ID=CAMNT_0000378185 /DNA_START=162 /DNA_END=2054 /DNA_ORIENTATION=- /assembly_acc=CAM_ASM_000159
MVRNILIIVASMILTSSAFLSVVQPAEGTSSNNNSSNSNTNNRKSHLRRKRLAENVGLLMQVDGAVDSSTSKKKGSSTHNAAAAAVHKTPSVAGGGRKDRGRDLAAADEEFGREQKQKQQRRHNQERKQRKSIRQDKELSDAIASAEEVLRDLFDDNRYLQVVSMSMSMVGGRTEDSSSASYNSQEDIYSSSSGARVPTSPFDGRLDTPETPTQITSDEDVVEEETPPTTDGQLDTPPETPPSTPSDTTVEIETPEEAISDGQMMDTPGTSVSEGTEDTVEEIVTEEEPSDGAEDEVEAEAEGQADELDTPETPTSSIPSDTMEQEEPDDGLLDALEIPSLVPSNTTGQETNIDVQPSTNSTTQEEEEVQEDLSSSEATTGASPSSPATDTTTAVGEELDVDRFDVVLTYQNEPGVCSGSASGIGCAGEASGSDMGGNPNTLLNCYDVTSFTIVDDESDPTAEDTNSSTIVELKEVTFWIGESSDLPRDLSVRVWDSVDGTIGSGPNNLLFEQDVLDYSAGKNTIFLDVATGDDSLIPENGVVCVGVYSESVEDGLRIQTESPPADDSGAPVDPVGSFLMTPSCGLTDFTSLSDLTVRGGLCIEAIVSVTTTTTASSATSAESSVETGKL